MLFSVSNRKYGVPYSKYVPMVSCHRRNTLCGKRNSNTDYYQYVKKNPVTKWNSPTYILYGGKDNLQSLQAIEDFAKSNYVTLTISEQSEHSFMGNEDDKVIKNWLYDNL